MVSDVPLLSVWQQIIQLDHRLFFLINRQGSSDILDAVLPFLRESQIWWPFYLFLITFSTLNFGKKGWWWVLLFFITAGLCDLMSSHLIKELIVRVRPCQNPALFNDIIIRAKYCPQSSSFTSSHATTHFGLAIFVYQTFKQLSKWWALIFLWAFAICYTQVYVGVHYPLDVFCGALLGCVIGATTSQLYRKQFGLINFDKQPAT